MPDILLRAEALEKNFGGLRAVSDVFLEVRTGEIHAVIGPNGAGKSTLIALLSGELPVTSGSISIGGKPVTRLSPDRRGLAGMGRSYQKTTIFGQFSVFENVRLAAQARSPQPLRMFRHARHDEAVNERADEALKTVGLELRRHETANLLSYGEQRQLEIAMVMATDPKIVLLDEPLAGMGQVESRTMIELIGSLKSGRAVLLIEHDMDAVFMLADRLTVMADGHVIASGTPDEVRLNAAVRTAYLGNYRMDP